MQNRETRHLDLCRKLTARRDLLPGPEVTRPRIYLETLERVFGSTDKIILDAGGAGGGGVVPYLPLGDPRPKTTPAPTGGVR